MNKYLSEGRLLNTLENRFFLKNIHNFQDAMSQDKILEARADVCDSEHNIIVDLGFVKGIIPREEGAIGIKEGNTKDIALISRVNKPVCFKIMSINFDNDTPIALLSRKEAQEECLREYVNNLMPGDVIPAKVTHLEQFGCFVDIGCGIPSLIPIDAISVSRISHPSDRFFINQDIYVVVKNVEDNRVCLSHKELLGTWQENADRIKVGETIGGVIRSVESYGTFIEIAPNLAGLAEPKENVKIGQSASIYIKSIIPEKMKIKLIIIDVFDSREDDRDFDYFITEGNIRHWKYSTESAPKNIETIFY